MKILSTFHWWAGALALFCAGGQTLLAQGTAFTYQGRLNDGASPANGNYDLRFALYDASSGNAQQGSAITNAATVVSNGLFVATLDFGAGVFTGAERWLEIGVRSNGSPNNFTALLPRQRITSTPFAVKAQDAAVAGSVAAANIVGTILPAQLPASVVTNGANGLNLMGTFGGNGAGLSNVTAQIRLGDLFTFKTLVYSSSGTYTVTVPPDAATMHVKLWGAGGGAIAASGGGGAYASFITNVIPGETYVVVIGQSGNAGGGAGANNGSGGVGAATYPFPGSGAGGQASSLFKFMGSSYIMKAVAGGGGGSGTTFSGGPTSGGAGTAGGNGHNYSANAITIGETNLNLMGGVGGNGYSSGSPFTVYHGGGGGGYGGGAAGNGFPFSTGGDGGGSYGDQTIGGNGAQAANTGDPNYVCCAGNSGADGLAVVLFTTTNAVNVPGYIRAAGFAGDGSWLTSLDASQITSGTLPDARLSANVAKRPFVVNQVAATSLQPINGSPNFSDINSSSLTVTVPQGTAVITWSVTSSSSVGANAADFRPSIGGLVPATATRLYFNQANIHATISGSYSVQVPGGSTVIKLQARANTSTLYIDGNDTLSWTLTVYPD